MALVGEYHWKVIDHMNVVQGYFKTEGLAHQWIQEEYPYKTKKHKSGSSLGKVKDGQVLPGPFYIRKVFRR